MDNRRAAFWLLFLGGAALVALIPEFFPAPDEVPLVSAERAAALPAAAPAESPAPEARAAGAGVPGGADFVLFAAHSWRPAPPPVPAVVWTPPPAPVLPEPPPTAPVLPFAFLGRLDDAERLRVFLTRDEKIYTVTVGAVIDGTYRVERIADSEIVLTYLPLNVTQTLSVGERL